MTASSESLRHESAVGHVTGRAIYTDEQRPPSGMLSVYPVQAPHAHARIKAIDTEAAKSAKDVVAIFTAADLDAFLDDCDGALF